MPSLFKPNPLPQRTVFLGLSLIKSMPVTNGLNQYEVPMVNKEMGLLGVAYVFSSREAAVEALGPNIPILEGEINV